jgi:transcriptional regulator with XRE-family HTH domain
MEPLNTEASAIIVARLRAERRARHLSAAELAARCAAAGWPELDRRKISKIENGMRASITADEVAGLSAALGVDLWRPPGPRGLQEISAEITWLNTRLTALLAERAAAEHQSLAV